MNLNIYREKYLKHLFVRHSQYHFVKNSCLVLARYLHSVHASSKLEQHLLTQKLTVKNFYIFLHTYVKIQILNLLFYSDKNEVSTLE